MAKTKEEKQARKESKNAAFDTLKNLVIKSGDEVAKKALAAIRPSLFGIRTGGGGGSAKFNEFLEMFPKIGAGVSEMKVFETMKAGRKEAAGFIKQGLKKSEPSERKWISFDVEKGMYTLKATGANAPKGWTGYVPVSVDVNELK